MDLDIEMDDAAQEPLMEDIPKGDDILQPDEPEELGEVIEDDPPTATVDDESKIIVPTKVHIRGVDTLHTDDIKAYVKTNFGLVDKVEWIDDTSANLVFSSEHIARDALVALATVEIADATALAVGETLPAKPAEGRSETSLQIRFAVQSDRKQAGAAQRSRYYLLHPEHDPEERRRRNQEQGRNRYRDRDTRGSGRYRRRGSEDDEIETYEASMYDDVPRSLTRPRRRSDSRDDRRRDSFSQQNKGKELFAGGRASRGGRGRSASPIRDRDGDAAMDEEASSSGNRVKARSLKDRITSDHRNNRSKELFPSKGAGRGGQLDQLERAIGSAQLKEEDRPKIVEVASDPNRASFNIRGAAHQHSSEEGFSIKGAAANARELFPSKLGNSNAGKELMDGSKSKRPSRQRAEDLFG